MPIIKGRTDTGAIIYSDGFKSYDGLVNYGYKRHYRVKHGENEFALGHNHINGIENFWGLCKVRLAKFRGVHRHTFYLHIKECEFRYNYRNQNLYPTLLKNFRNHPLKLSWTLKYYESKDDCEKEESDTVINGLSYRKYVVRDISGERRIDRYIKLDYRGIIEFHDKSAGLTWKQIW